MTQEATHLTRFYNGWNNYQDVLIEMISPLSDELLSFRAAPQLRPMWEIAAHIISARVYWFHMVSGEGSAELRPMVAWDDEGQPLRSASQLVRGLNESWALIDECLQRWTPADLDELRTTTSGTQWSRQWLIWHVLEHDMHHGGEISLMLGMNGLTVPDL